MEKNAVLVRAAKIKKWGSWLNWEETLQLGWNDILNMESSRLQFKLKSDYYVISRPTNLET